MEHSGIPDWQFVSMIGEESGNIPHKEHSGMIVLEPDYSLHGDLPSFLLGTLLQLCLGTFWHFCLGTLYILFLVFVEEY